MNLLYSFLVLHILSNNLSAEKTEDLESTVIEKDPSVKELAQSLVEALGVNIENDTSKRIQELREKLEKIASYVIDKDKYADLLRNETKENNLTEVNFFKALNESDHFQYLLEKDPKNIYLKLKENMNRDDILKILSKKKESKLGKTARRMTDKEPVNEEDGDVDYEVDKYIGAKAADDHMFDEKEIEQLYWDPQPELEDTQAPTRRIYKGERTTVRHYPFMVSIHVMKRFWCGGVLYWHDMVITSASCLQLMHNNRFFRENPKVLQVRVGSNHSRIGGEMVDALEVFFHPGYNPRTLRNNIAVIRLRYRLKFSYHRIPKIIRISHKDHLVPYTSQVLLLGWGVIRSTSKMRFEPVFMQRKVLPVYPNKFCQEVYGEKFVTNQMFCAGTMTTGEGACDHDAGGPAILHGQLVGVISFGPTVCGFPNAPTVFTLVGAFSDWIESVNESMPSHYRGYKRTTFATPSTYDLRSLQSMLKEVTGQTETPAIPEHHLPSTPEAPTAEADDRLQRIIQRQEIPSETQTYPTPAVPNWLPTLPKVFLTTSTITTTTIRSPPITLHTAPWPKWLPTRDIPLGPNESYEAIVTTPSRPTERLSPPEPPIPQQRYPPGLPKWKSPKTTRYFGPTWSTTQPPPIYYFTMRRGARNGRSRRRGWRNFVPV